MTLTEDEKKMLEETKKMIAESKEPEHQVDNKYHAGNSHATIRKIDYDIMLKNYSSVDKNLFEAVWRGLTYDRILLIIKRYNYDNSDFNYETTIGELLFEFLALGQSLRSSWNNAHDLIKKKEDTNGKS